MKTLCANCGRLIEPRDDFIQRGIMEEGEGCCSESCFVEYDRLGCPLESGGYRIKEVAP